MNSNQQPRGTRDPSLVRPWNARPYRQPDPVDGPPRPLGDKRAALQARRQRASSSKVTTGARGNARAFDRLLTSSDSTLAFAIRSTAMGLLVERTHCPPGGPRIVQTMVFDSADGFDRWCTLEPVRFDDPMLYDQLRRHGHEALDGAG